MNREDMRELAHHLWNGLEGYIGLTTLRRLGPTRTEPGTAHERFFKYPEALEDGLAWAEQEERAGRDVYFCAHLLIDESRRKTGREGDVPSSGVGVNAIVERGGGRRPPLWFGFKQQVEEPAR